jgi:sulfate transporter 4
MFLGVEIGLAIAVSVSLLLVTYESAYPHTAVLGRLPGTNVYRNVKQYPEAERYDGIVMIRIDAPIYFANTQNVREKISKYELAAEEQMAHRNGTVKYVCLEMSPVSHVDTSALHILEDITKTYRERGIQLCICNPGVRVMERFVLSGLAGEIGRDHFFACIHDCVNWCLDEMDVEESSLFGGNPKADDSLNGESSNGDVEAGMAPNNPPSFGGGVVFAPEDVEQELREEMENKSNTVPRNAKVSFASLGTGQL